MSTGMKVESAGIDTAMEGSLSKGTGVFILGAKRTAIGSLGGQLSRTSLADLGGAAIAGAFLESGLPDEAVEACHMGHVLSAGVGQAPARQAANVAALKNNVVTTSVNKVCAAGMAALIIGCMEVC